MDIYLRCISIRVIVQGNLVHETLVDHNMKIIHTYFIVKAEWQSIDITMLFPLKR